MTAEIPIGYETFEPAWDDAPILDTVDFFLWALALFFWIVATFLLYLIDPILVVGAIGVSLITIILHECIHAAIG